MAKAAVAAVLAAVLLVPTAAADTPSAEVIRLLNAQRTASGIPGGITENATWSANCAKHNAYMRQNGITHFEEKDKPGYTPEGEEAGKNAVLSEGSSWSTGNPFETAPVHLMQLLGPRLKSMGVDDAGGFVCATTWPGMDYDNGPPANVVLTYPGDGATGWRASEVAAEDPSTPGQYVGLPKGTRTGPYIYALLDGPGQLFSLRSQAKVTSATLTGPNGPVELKTIDSTHPDLGPYMLPGAYIIPVPTLANGKHTASVTFDVGGSPVTKTWSFTVGPAGTGPTPVPPPTKPALKATPSVASKFKGTTASGTITCSTTCRLTLTLTAKGFKKALATKTYTATKAGKVKFKLKLPKSAKGKVKKAKLKISAKNLAGGTSPKTVTKTIKFSP